MLRYRLVPSLSRLWRAACVPHVYTAGVLLIIEDNACELCMFIASISRLAVIGFDTAEAVG